MARIVYEQPSPVRILPRDIDLMTDEEMEIWLVKLAGTREMSASKPKRAAKEVSPDSSRQSTPTPRAKRGGNIVNDLSDL